VGYYTDWFIAGRDEAEAIASTATTEEHSFEDWPHYSVKNIGLGELGALWAILRGGPFNPGRLAAGDLLFEGGEEGPYVFEVVPAFIEALAGVSKQQAERHAVAWAQTEGLARWPVPALAEIIAGLADFARRARAEGKLVLELAVL
jgi:hypothetical protein